MKFSNFLRYFIAGFLGTAFLLPVLALSVAAFCMFAAGLFLAVVAIIMVWIVSITMPIKDVTFGNYTASWNWEGLKHEYKGNSKTPESDSKHPLP